MNPWIAYFIGLGVGSTMTAIWVTIFSKSKWFQ